MLNILKYSCDFPPAFSLRPMCFFCSHCWEINCKKISAALFFKSVNKNVSVHNNPDLFESFISRSPTHPELAAKRSVFSPIFALNMRTWRCRAVEGGEETAAEVSRDPPPLPELSELPPWRAEGEIKTGCEILSGMKRARRTNDLFFSAARVCFCETGGSLLTCSYPASSWGRRRLCSGLLMSPFPFWRSHGRCRLAHTSTLTVKGEQLPSGCVFVTPVTSAIKLLLGHFKYSIEPQTKKNNSRTRLSVGHKYTGGVRHTKVWAHLLFRTHKNKRIFKK